MNLIVIQADEFSRLKGWYFGKLLAILIDICGVLE